MPAPVVSGFTVNSGTLVASPTGSTNTITIFGSNFDLADSTFKLTGGGVAFSGYVVTSRTAMQIKGTFLASVASSPSPSPGFLMGTSSDADLVVTVTNGSSSLDQPTPVAVPTVHPVFPEDEVYPRVAGGSPGNSFSLNGAVPPATGTLNYSTMAPAANNSVTITGSGFGTSPGGSLSCSAGGFTFSTPAVASWSDTQIRASFTAMKAGPNEYNDSDLTITVTNGAGIPILEQVPTKLVNPPGNA